MPVAAVRQPVFNRKYVESERVAAEITELFSGVPLS
jgi:hypothetical protein